jgi:hypothetical protein
METIPDLSWIQTLFERWFIWALLLVLVYLVIGALWGSWLGRLKDELGRTPTFAEALRRLFGRPQNP